MQHQVITSPLLREASRKVVSKDSCGTLQFCILNQTVPVKNASHIDSFVHFSPDVLLCFLQNRPSSHRRMQSLAKKTAEERESTDFEPEEKESDAGTLKKGPKRKEEPDPGLTIGTDIEDYLRGDGKQAEAELNRVRIEHEKMKGQIRRTDSKLPVKSMESLGAARPTRPIYVVLWEDNSMFPADGLPLSLREPSHINVCTAHRWRSLVCIRTAQR